MQDVRLEEQRQSFPWQADRKAEDTHLAIGAGPVIDVSAH